MAASGPTAQPARGALLAMLRLQRRMNARIHEDWLAQGFAWHRAVWVECGELLEHYGYKWWKQHAPDAAQVQLEVIDIWHFGMSAALAASGGDEAAAADAIFEALAQRQPSGAGVVDAAEALALHALQSRAFCPARFRDVMLAADLNFDALHRRYIGKNVLNMFRQNHGYKEGGYRKTWAGREDNEHLAELAASLDADDESFSDTLYQSLEKRYKQ